MRLHQIQMMRSFFFAYKAIEQTRITNLLVLSFTYSAFNFIMAPGFFFKLRTEAFQIKS